MTEPELVAALRPDSRNPNEVRDPSDLGRFGLGLKTASFSQCRALTVFSKPAGGAVSYWTWDLDYVAQTGLWHLVRPEPPYGLPVRLRPAGAAAACRCGCGLPVRLRQQQSGTIVLWDQLDRVVSDAPASDEKAHARFLAVADAVNFHLSMGSFAESCIFRYLAKWGWRIDSEVLLPTGRFYYDRLPASAKRSINDGQYKRT